MRWLKSKMLGLFAFLILAAVPAVAQNPPEVCEAERTGCYQNASNHYYDCFFEASFWYGEHITWCVMNQGSIDFQECLNDANQEFLWEMEQCVFTRELEEDWCDYYFDVCMAGN